MRRTDPAALVMAIVVTIASRRSLVEAIADNRTSDMSDSSSAPTSLHEYCHLETFRPRCRHGDVIVMETALFGRMRVGRCIVSNAYLAALQKVDPTIIGCSANVLGYVDRICSGRTTCDVSVASPELHKFRPCSAELTMHLEAQYSCASVVEEDRSCSVSVAVGSRLHISSSGTTSRLDSDSRRRCGSREHPWMLEAQTGQQINISLLDFTVRQQQQQQQQQDVDRQSTGGRRVHYNCPSATVQYGYIVDKMASVDNKNVSICGASLDGLERHKPVYTSKGNTVEIVLMNDSSSERNQSDNFLLGLKAVGCSNIVPPVDAWMKRTDKEATVGCFTSRHRWQLRCEGNQWMGTLGECSNEVAAADADSAVAGDINTETTSSNNFIQVLAIVATSFVGLAVCLIIIFVGIGCARRFKPNLQQLNSNKVVRPDALLHHSVDDESSSLNSTTLHPFNPVLQFQKVNNPVDQSILSEASFRSQNGVGSGCMRQAAAHDVLQPQFCHRPID